MTRQGTIAFSTIKAFVSTTLIQVWRDGSAFFMVVLPIAIIVIIGTTFGNADELEIGVVGTGPDADALIHALDDLDTVRAERVASIDDARRLLRRFDIEATVVIEGDLADRGAGIIVNEANESGFAARSIIRREVDRIAFPPQGQPTPVEIEQIGSRTDDFTSAGPFARTAAQNLVLFTFINSLLASAILVRARRQGVLRRALAAPAGTVSILLGLASAWFALAITQSLIILVVGRVVFAVPWGDPVGAVALLASFALVGTGAGLLIGALMNSEEQTSAISPPLGLVLAALGGCMVPIEVFSDSMLRVSKLTPHYWALEGWNTLIFRGGGLSDILTELSVLWAVAFALLASATIALQYRLTRG